MSTITVAVKRAHDGGAIASIGGWMISGDSDFAEKNNGKTFSEWDRRRASEQEKKAIVYACRKFFEAGRPNKMMIEYIEEQS